MKLWEKIFFGAFLFWSVAGFIFTVAQITPGTIADSHLPGWLKDFVEGCIRTGDPLLILLAFANTHLHAAREWTPPVARRWALIILVCALGIEMIGVATGFPFGRYAYTDRFGPMVGGVPLTIPLAWHVVVTNAWFSAHWLTRDRSRILITGLTALICMLYDFVLEPFATGAKQYWLWRGDAIPLQNYAAWFVLSALLVWFFAPKCSERYPSDPRPPAILIATMLIFLAGSW
jgi:putative membrane protein